MLRIWSDTPYVLPQSVDKILKTAAFALAGCCPARAGTWQPPSLASLRFYHTHTGEKLDLVYYENGAYLPDALERN